MNPHKKVELALVEAQECLKDACHTSRPLDERTEHDLAGLVFATGAQLLAWRNRFKKELEL